MTVGSAARVDNHRNMGFGQKEGDPPQDKQTHTKEGGVRLVDFEKRVLQERMGLQTAGMTHSLCVTPGEHGAAVVGPGAIPGGEPARDRQGARTECGSASCSWVQPKTGGSSCLALVLLLVSNGHHQEKSSS